MLLSTLCLCCADSSMLCCAVHHVQAPKKLAEAIQDDRLVMEHFQAFLRPPEPRWALGSMGTSCGGRLGA